MCTRSQSHTDEDKLFPVKWADWQEGSEGWLIPHNHSHTAIVQSQLWMKTVYIVFLISFLKYTHGKTVKTIWTKATCMVNQSKLTEPNQHANNFESNITAVSSTEYCATYPPPLPTCCLCRCCIFVNCVQYISSVPATAGSVHGVGELPAEEEARRPPDRGPEKWHEGRCHLRRHHWDCGWVMWQLYNRCCDLRRHHWDCGWVIWQLYNMLWSSPASLRLWVSYMTVCMIWQLLWSLPTSLRLWVSYMTVCMIWQLLWSLPTSLRLWVSSQATYSLLICSILGCVLPLQEVALCQSLPAFSVTSDLQVLRIE